MRILRTGEKGGFFSLKGLLLLYAFTVPLSKSISAILMAIVATFTVLGALKDYKRRFAPFLSDGLFWVLAIFTAIYILGLINTEDLRRGFKVCKNISIVLGTYLVLALKFRRPEEGEELLRWFVAGVVVLDLIALGKFLGLYGGSAFKLPSAAVMNPIWFGNVSALSLYTSLLLFHRSLSGGAREALPWALASLVNLMGLVLSTSRGAWVATVLVTLIIMIPLFWRVYLGKVFALLFLVGLLLFYVHPFSRAKFSRTFQDVRAFFEKGKVSSSVGARLGMWKLCYDILKDHSVFGAGTGDYIVEVKRRTEEHWAFLRRYNQPHSIYFHSMAMHGLVGLGSLLLVFVFVIRESLREIGEGGLRRLLGLVALAVALHYMVAGVSETVLKIHVLVTIFGMVLGCCFGHRVWRGARDA
ncbi:MAG: hypothetical protein DRG69_03840 [Deltaproteobacteria bacterium]|nr:MAG: hypothetical protein DRG69_03840 [Deltaproteobacteria bacterium]